jgi:hypothetical protein
MMCSGEEYVITAAELAPIPLFAFSSQTVFEELVLLSGKRTNFFGVNRGSKHFASDLQQLFEWLKDGRIAVPIKNTFSQAFRVDRVQSPLELTARWRGLRLQHCNQTVED